MNIRKLPGHALAATLALAAAASAQVVTTVADFEKGTADNNTSGFWYYVDDSGNGGNSQITSGDTAQKPTAWSEQSVATPGFGTSTKAAKLGFVFGTNMLTCGEGCTPYDPEIIIGTDIRDAADSVVNLTGATKLTFAAKAEPKLDVTVVYVSADITDYSYFRRKMTIGTEWKEYTILLPNGFLATDWGQSKAKLRPDPSQAKAINWVVSRAQGNASVKEGALYIDDLKIHGWAPGPASIRSHARSAAARALRASADGKALRFRVPDAYREVAGKVAAVDLSGRVLAEAAFGKGQENVTLRLAQRTSAPVFFRVFTAGL